MATTQLALEVIFSGFSLAINSTLSWVAGLIVGEHSKTFELPPRHCHGTWYFHFCRPGQGDLKNLPLEGTKCTIVDVQEICGVWEKVTGVASEDWTDPGTHDFVPLEWSADVSAAHFLTVTETEFQISALKSGGVTDFPDVLSATTSAQDQSRLRS